VPPYWGVWSAAVTALATITGQVVPIHKHITLF